jgi:hypothetical protein
MGGEGITGADGLGYGARVRYRSLRSGSRKRLTPGGSVGCAVRAERLTWSEPGKRVARSRTSRSEIFAEEQLRQEPERVPRAGRFSYRAACSLAVGNGGSGYVPIFSTVYSLTQKSGGPPLSCT